MADLNKRIDPRSFPILGLLGVAACGPTIPQDSGGTDATGTSAGDTGTGPTDPTAPTTTEPSPECQVDSDCYDTYCGFCVEGTCREGGGCCGYGASLIGSKWRCSPPPYYDCYGDADCEEGYLCMNGECIVDDSPIVLPSCAPPDADVTQWNLSNAPTAFILADLDGDLDLDLAAAEPASGSIEIALNDGTGNFVLAGAFGVAPGATGELALAAGDLDLDGDLDLAVTQPGAFGALNLLFNDGAVFTVGDPHAIAPQPTQVFIADINGDGAPDVLTVHDDPKPVGLQLGDGTGKLSNKQSGVADLLTGRAWVGDLSGDGIADLFAPVSSGATLWVGGPAPVLSSLRTFTPNAELLTALGGDLGSDGHPEVMLLHPVGAQGMAQVWSGTAPEAWAFDPQRYTTTLPLTGGVLAEIDVVPGPDLLSATGSNKITLLPGGGNGGFVCEHIIDITGTSSPALIAVGDVDGDGRPDILAGGVDLPTLTLIRPVL